MVIGISDPSYLPSIRSALLESKNYVAGRRFLRGTTWFSDGHPTRRYLFDETGTLRRKCTIVGVVLAEGLKVASFGDFVTPSDGQSPQVPVEESCFRIQLGAPPQGEDGFSSDFKAAVENIEDLLYTLRYQSISAKPFLAYTEDGQTILSLQLHMFPEKWSPDFDAFGTEISLDGVVIDGIPAIYLDPIRITRNARDFESRDHNGAIMSASKRAECLRNALVEISFGLSYDTRLGLVGEIDHVTILK